MIQRFINEPLSFFFTEPLNIIIRGIESEKSKQEDSKKMKR